MPSDRVHSCFPSPHSKKLIPPILLSSNQAHPQIQCITLNEPENLASHDLTDTQKILDCDNVQDHTSWNDEYVATGIFSCFESLNFRHLNVSGGLKLQIVKPICRQF